MMESSAPVACPAPAPAVDPRRRHHLDGCCLTLGDYLKPDGWVAEHIRDYVATDGRRASPDDAWRPALNYQKR